MTRRLAVAALVLLPLAGCYTSDTKLLTEANSTEIPGVGPGLYCHLEVSLDPATVSAGSPVSAALGNNKCRELEFDPESARYIDALSPGMDLRIGEIDGPLWLLQAQTNSAAPARFAPIAATDGLFIQFDPQGRWPDSVQQTPEATFDDDGMLLGATPQDLAELLALAFEDALGHFREDLTIVQEDAEAQLRFTSYDRSFSYLLYAREDLRADPALFAAALDDIAAQLDLAVEAD
ncbi:hypothetical protein [Devosia sp.]|uniref:hypothetical protein n=1 Tax=Devosia sp. TaxID=1871048 RepID=UPI003A90A3F8